MKISTTIQKIQRSGLERWPTLTTLLLFLFTLAPIQGNTAESNWINGITEPIMDVTMSFPVVGVLSTRSFEEGASVTKGQVVAELDKRIEELDVERKRHVRDLAKIELDRITTLAQKSAISVSREEIDKKQAEFEIANLEHQLSQENARRRWLISPLDGYVIQYFRQVGESCPEHQMVVRLVDIRQCYFIANLESKWASFLKTGATVRLRLDSGNQATEMSGTVCYVAPVVDPASGLLRIKAIFSNLDGKIKPGVTGRILIE